MMRQDWRSLQAAPTYVGLVRHGLDLARRRGIDAEDERAPAPPQGRRVVFLDVDGVLTHPPSWMAQAGLDDDDPAARLWPAPCALLVECVHALGAEVVLSSDWRRLGVARVERLIASAARSAKVPPNSAALAAWSITDRTRKAAVVGVPGHNVRGLEIADWCARHRPIRVAVLDDYHVGHVEPGLCKVDGASIDIETMADLARVLHAPMGWAPDDVPLDDVCFAEF